MVCSGISLGLYLVSKQSPCLMSQSALLTFYSYCRLLKSSIKYTNLNLLTFGNLTFKSISISGVPGSPSSSMGSNSFTSLSPFNSPASNPPPGAPVPSSTPDPWGYPSSYEISHLNILNDSSYQPAPYCNSPGPVYSNNYPMMGKSDNKK